MAISLSIGAQSLIKEIGIQPQIVLDIEGMDLIFGARPILKVLFWDYETAFWDSGLFWDGSIDDQRSRDYISLDGTTTSISQQIAPDKGSTSSISTVNVSIVDKNGEVSKAVAFDNISEILGRKATFSIGFATGNYPEDMNPIFRGVVVDFYTTAGMVMISLASPESLKRQVLFEKFQTETTAAITNSATSIPLIATDGVYLPQDAVLSYLKVDDELMRITSKTGTSATVQRGQLDTVAVAHDINAPVETFYRLQGRPIDLALKLMLSKEGNSYFDSFDLPKSIEFVSLGETIQNAIIFDYYDIQDKTGLTIGDSIKLNSPANTGTYTISFFGIIEEGGSYIVANQNLAFETEYVGGFSYRSKYNTLNTGLGMLTSEVDVAQFELIETQFSSNFVDYDLYVKDTIDDSKDFIDRQIFFPQGLYSIPRKARSSVKFVAPPFSSDIVPVIDVRSILNAPSIKQRRSIHKYFYNTYVYRYNIDSLEDKYLTGKVIVSGDSVDRINVGKKQLRIESDGLRNNAATTSLIENLSQRLVDRYQFAPVYFDDIEVNYKTGYTIEVGDIVPFGGPDLKVTNLQSGERGTELKLFEVVNKSLNIKDGTIKLSLASTAFDINSRYAVIGPSSIIGTGNTTQRIKITKTNNTGEWLHESDKWRRFEGQLVAVRSADYSFYQEVYFDIVDLTDKDFLLLRSPLSFVPASGYIVEPAEYYDADVNVNDLFKIEVAHFDAMTLITSVTSTSVFNVADSSKLAVGSYIYVNNNAYTRDSFGTKVKIDSIVGATVTLNTGLPFTPVIGDSVNNSDFHDGGGPYTLL
jgi:hypothetical protein